MIPKLYVYVLASAVALAATAAGGCARARARTVPDAPPPLDVPAPPPRDIETTESEPPPLIPLPQEPAHTAPPRTRPAPPSQTTRPAEPKPEAPKPEPPPESEAPKPDEPSRPATLQTTQAEADMERHVRTTLGRAQNELNRVDYRMLNADARTQYEAAKSFIDQADKAIRSKNLVFAKTLADKAALIATQLSGK